MRVKKGFTLLELCVGVILTGIVFSISFSYFYQMHRISSDLVKKQLDDLEYSIQVLQEEKRLRSKCILFYTDKEEKIKTLYKLKAANRCRF